MLGDVFRVRTLFLALSAALAVPAHAEVDLTELSLEQLLDVSVTGASKYEQKQVEVAAAVTVITRQEIRSFGWRTLDDALASLPGVYSTYDRQYNYLGTRGFGLPGDFNTRVLLMINGNRVNEVVYDGATTGQAFPIDMDLIERIEFIPGPGGAVYGQNAVFGVINVVTRTGADVQGTELALSYQDLNAVWQGRATWGRKLDNGADVMISASGFEASGEDHYYDFGQAGVSGVARGMDGQTDKEFYARFARGPWAFDFTYGDHSKDDPTAQYFSDPLVSGQYQADSILLTQLQYQDSLAGGTLELSGRVFLGSQRYEGKFYYSGSPYLATGSGDWQGVEARLLSSAWVGHKLSFGLEAQNNSRQDQTNEDLYDPANDVVIPGSGWRAGIYVQDEWTLSPSLRATLGLRLDANNVTDPALSPRAALIWTATPATIIRGLYGRAHRAPNSFERDYDDVFSQIANPELNGETIDTLELVVDQRVGQDLLLRAAAYYWNMQDLVVLDSDPNSGLSQYRNGSDVDAIGIELSLDKYWNWGGRLRGSLTWQDAAYADGGQLDNSPPLLAKLNFSSPLGSMGVRLGFELQYAGERQAIDGTDLDGYWLSNLHLRADDWVKGLEVSLGLYNLFDARYDHPGSDINWQNALEQDGRSVRLKLSYRF